MPRRAFDRHHRSCGIRKKVIREARHERTSIRKPGLEELLDGCVRCQSCETVCAFEWKKEDARESSINVRESDEHVIPAWPDMQGVLVEHMRACISGRYCELLVAVVEILLQKIKPGKLEHLVSDRRCRAIAADDNIRFGQHI